MDRRQGRGRIRKNRTIDRQTEWASESDIKKVDKIGNDTINIMKLDQEVLEPLLSPIVSDISGIKNDMKNHSELQNLHNKSLQQTQIVGKESDSRLKYIHKKSIPSLEKKTMKYDY